MKEKDEREEREEIEPAADRTQNGLSVGQRAVCGYFPIVVIQHIAPSLVPPNRNDPQKLKSLCRCAEVKQVNLRNLIKFKFIKKI